MQLDEPKQGEDVRILWRYVADAVTVLNAITNMKVTVEGKVVMFGKFENKGDSSHLQIFEGKETG